MPGRADAEAKAPAAAPTHARSSIRERGRFKQPQISHSLALFVFCLFVRLSQRENYLGHSLLAPVGRWQQGRDLTWYAKQKAPPGAAGTAAAAASAQQTALELERAAIKAEEEERRLEALGIRKRVPKPPPAPEALDPREAAQLFGRTKTEPTEGDAAAASTSDADRVSGLGFRADGVPAGGAGSMQLEAGDALEGTASAAAAGGMALPASSGAAPDLDAVALSEEALLADPTLDAASRAILMEAAAIRAKEAKKRHKKEKKEKEKKSKKDRKKDKEKDRGRDAGSSSSHKRRSHSSSSSRSRSRSPAPARDRRRERRDSRSRSRSRSRDKQRRERDDRERR